MVNSRHGYPVVTGAQYAEIREKLGLSQQQLAWELGVHMNTVSRRERGESAVTPEHMLALRMLWIKRNYDVPEGW